MTHPSSGDPAKGRFLVVLPIITAPYADICVESLLMKDSSAEIDPADILVIDNTRGGWAAEKYGLPTYRDPDGHNLGVARSWNVGVRQVLDRGLDYLVIMSASMRFGPLIHTSWTRQMLEFWGERVIEAHGLSWHLIALHRTCFERIGLFDTNFHAYFESIDWCRRLRLVGWEEGFIHVWINALCQGTALHISEISCPAKPLIAYYNTKWRGDKGEEKYDLPWGDKPLDYFEEVPIPVLAERYGWENWW